MEKRVILVARGASGKDYFRDYLAKRYKVDVSYTTRLPRKGEIEGYTYNYISEEDFENKYKSGFFLEAVSFNSWRYGTSKQNFRDKDVFIMTPSGVKCIPKENREDCIVVFLDIDEDVRKERLSLRSDADSTDRRLLADEKDFEGFSDFDLRITNPKFNCDYLLGLILNYKNV